MEPNKDPRFISRRQFLKGAALAAGGFTLASCGIATTDAGSTANNGVAAGDTNVTVWFWDDSLQFAVDAFHQRQDQIRVNFVKTGFDDAHKKLLTSLVAQTGAPDLCAL